MKKYQDITLEVGDSVTYWDYTGRIYAIQDDLVYIEGDAYEHHYSSIVRLIGKGTFKHSPGPITLKRKLIKALLTE